MTTTARLGAALPAGPTMAVSWTDMVAQRQNLVRFAYSDDEGAHWSQETVSGAGAEPRAPPVSPRDPVLPVLALRHPAVFADHERGHGLAALECRDVETLDAARQRGQRQHGAQGFERVVVGGDVLVEAGLVGHFGVARREVEQTALFASLTRSLSPA